MATKGLNYVISLVDHVSKPMRGIVGTFDNLNRGILSIAGVGTVLAGATGAITAFVDSNLDALDEIHQLRNVTGEAVDYIYELGKVAEVNGSSTQAAQRSIEGLSKVIGEAAAGAGRGAKAFKLYGLSAKDGNGNIKATSEVMDDIMAKMQGMAEAEQIAMLSKLGIDATMIQTLRLTNQEMSEARKHAKALSLGVATSEAATAAADFKDAMTRLGQVNKGVREYISVRLAPTIQSMIEYFEGWFVANNELIKDGLNRTVQMLTRFLKGTVAFFGALDRVIKGTIGWRNALYGLVGVLALVKSATVKAFIFNPITWVTASIIGLILVIDDLLVYLRGGKSYLGAFWDKLFDLFNNHKADIAAVAGIFGGFAITLLQIKARFFGVAGSVLRLTGGFRGLGQVIRIVGSALRFAFVSNPVGLLITAITAAGYAIYKLIDKYGSLGEAADVAIAWIGRQWDDLIDKFMAQAWVKKITEGFTSIKDSVLGVWDDLKRGALNLINDIIALLNKMGANIEPIKLNVSVGTINTSSGAMGAAISGAMGATIPAAGIGQSAAQKSKESILDVGQSAAQKSKELTLDLNPNQTLAGTGKKITNAYRSNQTINQNITINTRGEINERKLAQLLKQEEFKARERREVGM